MELTQKLIPASLIVFNELFFLFPENVIILILFLLHHLAAFKIFLDSPDEEIRTTKSF